jgi:hypothetical protein
MFRLLYGTWFRLSLKHIRTQPHTLKEDSMQYKRIALVTGANQGVGLRATGNCVTRARDRGVCEMARTDPGTDEG